MKESASTAGKAPIDGKAAESEAKKRRVTRPRNSGIKTVRTVTYLPEKTRLAAEAAAMRRESSLTELIAGAVARCVKDDIWSPRVRSAVDRNKTLTPPLDLVKVSNQFVALGFLLEQMLKGGVRQDDLDEASRIYLDCQVQLDTLRSELGC